MTGNAILLVHITHSTKTEWEVKFLCEILSPLHVYLLMLHIYVAYTYVYICIYICIWNTVHIFISIFFSFVYFAYIIHVFHLNQDFVIVYILDEHLL